MWRAVYSKSADLNINLMYKHPHRNIKNKDQISEHHGPVNLTHKMNHHTLLAPGHMKRWEDRSDLGLSSAKLWLSFSPEMGLRSFLFFIFKGFFFLMSIF